MIVDIIICIFYKYGTGKKEGNEAIKINTFFVIIDKLVLELSKRSKAYTELDSLFNYFSNLLFICLRILKE
jgi:hypothetical protein